MFLNDFQFICVFICHSSVIQIYTKCIISYFLKKQRNESIIRIELIWILLKFRGQVFEYTLENVFEPLFTIIC